MLVSAVICTWNRSRLLDQTLRALHAVRVPAGIQWELLVVNNNCTDDTDDVMARHEGMLPLRRISEPRPGKSHAANRAVREAKGELILWTDDDVLVDAGWIESYVAAARRWPEAMFFGGPVTPWCETELPPWMRAELPLFANMLLLRDFGDQERALEAEELPVGANMALRRVVFEKHLFDPSLGPCEDSQVRGEEMVLLRSVVAEGHGGVWLPKASVRHFVPKDRLTTSYMWNYFRGNGRTLVRRDGYPEGVPLWGAPRWMYRKWLRLMVTATLRRLLARADWCRPYQVAALTSGMIDECRALRRNGTLKVSSQEANFPEQPVVAKDHDRRIGQARERCSESTSG